MSNCKKPPGTFGISPEAGQQNKLESVRWIRQGGVVGDSTIIILSLDILRADIFMYTFTMFDFSDICNDGVMSEKLTYVKLEQWVRELSLHQI
jgi:hypothetical protein